MSRDVTSGSRNIGNWVERLQIRTLSYQFMLNGNFYPLSAKQFFPFLWFTRLHISTKIWLS